MQQPTSAGTRIIPFVRSESVNRCDAITVLHLLQRPLHGTNDRTTKTGSPPGRWQRHVRVDESAGTAPGAGISLESRSGHGAGRPRACAVPGRTATAGLTMAGPALEPVGAALQCGARSAQPPCYLKCRQELMNAWRSGSESISAASIRVISSISAALDTARRTRCFATGPM